MKRTISHRIIPPSGLPIYHRGPPLEKGPLPGLFYFALSGHESLFLEPYNQPALFLEGAPIRVYSSTLPSHGPPFKNSEAMARWANAIQLNHNIIFEFLLNCRKNIDFLITEGFLEKKRIAVAGLSRGGFIALHLAALDPRISTILAFAPLTTLESLAEFHHLLGNPIVQSLNLDHLIEPLIQKKIRFYIGNRDTRVGTSACFHFTQKIVEEAYRHKIRSPEMELIISPSAGHKGHGTPSHIFQEGASWLIKQLGCIFE